VIEPFERLTKAEVSAVTEEGGRLLGFASAARADHEIRIA
jgi:hypothetical protein